MMVTTADLPRLKWSLLLLLAVVCLVGAAIVSSKKLVVQARSEQQNLQRRLATARGQLASANQDSANMKSYSTEYGEIVKRHILGAEQRLDWIEGMEKIRKQQRVLDFKYSIAPQHSYLLASMLGNGIFNINISEMVLQFDLLHEEQLLYFFDQLRNDSMGWFILDHCVIERNANNEAEAQLKAECAGGWITLKNVADPNATNASVSAVSVTK